MSVSKFLVRFFLGGAICTLSFTSFLGAQPNPGGDPDEEVPITGIELLIAAGAGYGAKKAYEVYKKSRK